MRVRLVEEMDRMRRRKDRGEGMGVFAGVRARSGSARGEKGRSEARPAGKRGWEAREAHEIGAHRSKNDIPNWGGMRVITNEARSLGNTPQAHRAILPKPAPHFRLVRHLVE